MKLQPHQKIKVLQFLFNHDGEALYISLISEGLCAAKSLISRYVKDLFERGLVTLSLGDHYRQRRYVNLTDKGREVCACLDDYFIIFEEVLG